MAFKGHQLEAYHDFVVDQAVEESVDLSTGRPAENEGMGSSRLVPGFGPGALPEGVVEVDGVDAPQQTQLDLGDAAAETRLSDSVARHRNERGTVHVSRLRSRRARPSRARRAIDESSHLVAARRLSKAIRRAPNRAEEARIGRLVCSHLIALLEETDQESIANGEPRR